MDRPSSRSNLFGVFHMIIRWRRGNCMNNSPAGEVNFNWTDIHLSVVRNYFSKFSNMYDLGAGTIFANTVASFTLQLRRLFMVPRMENLCGGVKKHQLVKSFVSFLLQLLYQRNDLAVCSQRGRIDKLEKELRFLLTILGDIWLIPCDEEHQEFQKLLLQIEAMANEAGGLVHSLFFAIDHESADLDEGLAVFFKRADIMEDSITEFLDLLPLFSSSAYITPKTSMVDSLQIVDSLIYDLEDMMMRREENQIADQIEMLHEGLSFLESSFKDIRALRVHPSQVGEFKDPLMRIGDMAHEAEYLIISFLGGDAPLWYIIKRLTDVNHKVKLIGPELQEIIKIWRLGVATSKQQLIIQPQRRMEEADGFTVGCEEKTTHVLHHLVRGTDCLQVISIFGMAGLGKTTLAKKLYNHPSVNCWFDRLSWCVVTQTCRRKSVMIKILTDTASELQFDERILQTEEESLAEHIHKTLKSRRYLIVLDDVWDSDVWYDLNRCFPDDENGSRILLTSRVKDAAPPNSTLYALPFLSKGQCWEVLKKKVFANKPCPPQLQEAGKKIAADCCGVPLAVAVTAGILSTMDEEVETWEEVGGNLASYILDGRDKLVMQILELSYNHLSEYLKPCFLYFGAYREDEEILVGELMRLWVAEGFVRKVGEKSAESVAEEYLMELVDKSLVTVAKKRSDGGVKACAIHDLWRDLCFKLSAEENFLKSVKSNDNAINEKGYRLKALQHSSTSYYCQHVRSFLGRGLISAFYVRDMRSLRVLSFYYCYRPIYFMGIQFLVNLRYLVVTYLPPSIARLVNLEYLRVETDENVSLRPELLKMMKLRYIHVNTEAIYDKNCDTSSQSNNLEFLSCVRISKHKHEEMLKCSPHLRKLKCCYDAYQHLNLQFHTQLDSLTLKFWPIMKGFGFPPNIRKLSLEGSKLSSEKMSIIGKLEKLEVLKLRCWAMVGEVWDTRDGEFEQLRFLKLDKLVITRWNVESSQHFPKLEKLVLSFCPNLEEIPSEIGEIATLLLIEVKGQCPGSLVESATRIHQQQLDVGNDELTVVVTDRKGKSQRLTDNREEKQNILATSISKAETSHKSI